MSRDTCHRCLETSQGAPGRIRTCGLRIRSPLQRCRIRPVDGKIRSFSVLVKQESNKRGGQRGRSVTAEAVANDRSSRGRNLDDPPYHHAETDRSRPCAGARLAVGLARRRCLPGHQHPGRAGSGSASELPASDPCHAPDAPVASGTGSGMGPRPPGRARPTRGALTCSTSRS